MVEPVNFKRLYELSIIEKEQIANDNKKHLEKINELTKELNEYKIENYGKKTYYQKNKEKIIEKVKEYNKTNVKSPEKIKEYNKKAYEKRKLKKHEEVQNPEK
jgi:hypothetical protein